MTVPEISDFIWDSGVFVSPPSSHKGSPSPIALCKETLRPEYQTADNQILLVTGGFGASPNARGSAVFVQNLYSGKQYRVERIDVLGVVKPEHVPAWAMESAAKLQAKDVKKAVPER